MSRVVIAGLFAAFAAATQVAAQQMPVHPMPMHAMPGMGSQAPAGAPMHSHAGSMPDMSAAKPGVMAGPVQPGQAAFGAIQEVIAILEADPSTDWSKVNLDALREHLIDMDEVTMRADAVVRHVEGGIEVAVTGQGRTLDAIRRMVPADAHHLDGLNGWTVMASDLPNGVTLRATSTDQKQAAIIRGLGFMGVLASGGYHQEHHLMIAKGAHM